MDMILLFNAVPNVLYRYGYIERFQRHWSAIIIVRRI